jgi:DNA-binding CsgD family transcriptional regulator
MKIVGKTREFDLVLDLSPMQNRVFELCGRGKTTEEIASEIGISRRTAEAHFESIKARLLRKNMSELRAYAGAYVYHCELLGVKRVDVPEARRRYAFEIAA